MLLNLSFQAFYLHKKIVRIAHPTEILLAKSQHPVAEPLNSFLDEKRKPTAVQVVKEDVLAGISTKNDVIQRAGIMNTWFVWHGIKIASISQLTILHA
jgi:hypothetical protein